MLIVMITISFEVFDLNLIRMNDVTFGYDDRPILENVTLDVHDGEWIVMMGPNGASKTTTLRLMLGIIKPWSGTVERTEKNDNGEKLSIGYVPQQINAFNTGFPSTVFELVSSSCDTSARWTRIPRTEKEHIVNKALQEVGMQELSSKRIGDLSGGQKQRLCIARALAMHPDLLILDEPTTGMDSASRAGFYELIKHHVKQHGRGVVMVTHHWEEVRPFADRSIILERKENVGWKCFTTNSCKGHFGPGRA